MKMKLKMVPLSQVADVYSGISMLDSSKAIEEALSTIELERYCAALQKIERKQKLDVLDLIIFNKIDAITYEKFGMCLKDSAVTRARITASKKHRMEFRDLDGLEDHMKQMENLNSSNNSRKLDDVELKMAITNLLLSQLGEEGFYELLKILEKVPEGVMLSIKELEILGKAEYIIYRELNLPWFSKEVRCLIESSCAKHGLNFNHFAKSLAH